jgi:hypothetical protein
MKTASIAGRLCQIVRPVNEAPSCGRQSCMHAAFQAASGVRTFFQAAFSIRDESLGRRRFHDGGHEAKEKACEPREWPIQFRRRPERPPLGTIACHTRRQTTCLQRPKPRGELRSYGQAEACPTKTMQRRHELRVHSKKLTLPLPPPRSHRAVLRSLRLRVSAVNNSPTKQAS